MLDASNYSFGPGYYFFRLSELLTFEEKIESVICSDKNFIILTLTFEISKFNAESERSTSLCVCVYRETMMNSWRRIETVCRAAEKRSSFGWMERASWMGSCLNSRL